MRTLDRWKETYPALKIREIRYRSGYKKNDLSMIKAMEHFYKTNNKKSRLKIRKEIKLCKDFWGCYPFHYFRYKLYEKNREMTSTELLDYVPEFFFYELFLPFHDSKLYWILLGDKNITEQVFRSSNIAQPETIFKLVNQRFFAEDLDEIDYASVERKIKESDHSKIFVKPARGQGGSGIFIFQKRESNQYLTKEGAMLDKTFFENIGASNDYIIQAGIDQHPEISKLHPHSVNTLRMATENRQGNVRVLCCALRMGKDANQLDNSSQGGLLSRVELESGKIGEYATTEDLLSGYLERHPNTGVEFKGYTVPYWEEAKAFALASARKLPNLAYVAWDIALTRDGPLAIEANQNFGLDLYQAIMGGLRGVFQVDDPNYYWYNTGRRISP